MKFFLTVQYNMIYAASIFLFPFLLLNSFFVEVRGKWLLFLGTQFCRMVTRPINIEIVSADMRGLSRNPTMFFQHFIECVFHFNGYEKHRGTCSYSSEDVHVILCLCSCKQLYVHLYTIAWWCCVALPCLIFLIWNHVHIHTVYNRFKQTEREKQLFSLKGSDCRSQRMAIYSFLLSHMTDTHRFQLTAKLGSGTHKHVHVHVHSVWLLP